MTTVAVHFGHLCRISTAQFVPNEDGTAFVSFRVASNRTRRAERFSWTVPFVAGQESEAIAHAWEQMMADQTMRDSIVQYVAGELNGLIPSQVYDVKTSYPSSISPKAFAVLDASQLSGHALGQEVASWGDTSNGQVAYAQTDANKTPTYHTDGYVAFRGDFMKLPDMTIELTKYGGFTAIARVRWVQTAWWQRMFCFAHQNTGGLVVALEETTTSAVVNGSRNTVTFELGVWVTVVLVHRYTLYGMAMDTWYKDGVQMDTRNNLARVQTQTFSHALIGRSSYSDNSDAYMDISHISFYHGALSEKQIAAALSAITP